MRKRRISIWVFLGVALVLAAGLRTDTGQGYSDPIVLPREVKPDTARSQRVLELRLTNRKTGRPQSYQWPLSVPAGGSVEVECHEWTLIRFFDFSLPGMPKNSFRRIIPLDRPEEGVAEPYHFVVRWRTE